MIWCHSEEYNTSQKIKILVQHYCNGQPNRISGWYGNTEVFSVHIVMGKWSTATSTCLPSDVQLAKKYIDVMNQVVNKLTEIGAVL
jgi:hypothetical protein